MRVIVLLLFLYLMVFAEINSTQNPWIQNSKISPALYKLIKMIEHDPTLLCKDNIDLTTLKNLIEGYTYVQNEALAISLIKEANKVANIYNMIKSKGCYDPAIFLEDNFLYATNNNLTNETNPILQKLDTILRKYLAIKKAGGWQKISIQDYIYLRRGKNYDEIPAIKKRLEIEGFGKFEHNDTLFDGELFDAIKVFQEAHGLKADGVIGPMTIATMNRSVEEKIEQILLNIERARWFVRDDDFFIFVDIPGFFMQVYNKGEPIFYSKVVVGRKSRPTPQMRNVISYVVLNPYWRAPKTIIQEDILPHLKNGEFQKIYDEHIVASLDPYGKKIIPFETIDWKNFNENISKVTFLQLPGPHNFLGFVKFMFPNRFDVYLHDTNARHLFKYEYRALSSGCVRVQKPIELMHILLSHVGKEMSYRDIFDILWASKNKKIYIRPNIPVYLLYLTVFIDKNDMIHFYPDIYGIDKKMLSYKKLQGYDKIAAKEGARK